MMTSVALRYCGSEEEALLAVNYGFLKVLQNIKSYRNEFTLATWMRRILVNHMIDEYRKTSKETEHVSIEEAELPETSQNLNLAEYRFSELELRHMLKQLPKMTRTVFNLYAIEGYKHAEIAALLNMSDGTSKWHVGEARRRLEAMLNSSLKEKGKLKNILV